MYLAKAYDSDMVQGATDGIHFYVVGKVKRGDGVLLKFPCFKYTTLLLKGCRRTRDVRGRNFDKNIESHIFEKIIDLSEFQKNKVREFLSFKDFH